VGLGLKHRAGAFDECGVDR
jgi:hypothetical protein